MGNVDSGGGGGGGGGKAGVVIFDDTFMINEFTRLRDEETQHELLEFVLSKEEDLDVLYAGGIPFFNFVLLTFLERLTL